MVGSLDINGIIEEAKAQGVVTAGDFVRFLTDYSESGGVKDVQIDSNANAGKIVSAVALSKNKVFIVYAIDTCIYSIVCTFSGTNIVVGTPTLSTQPNNSNPSAVSAVALNENKVFAVICCLGNSYLWGKIFTIKGTTITAESSVILNSTATSRVTVSVAKLDEGKVLVSYTNTSYKIYATVYTISGTTISVGTHTEISTSASTGKIISTVALSSSKVFVCFVLPGGQSAMYNLLGCIVSISGTTISKGDTIALATIEPQQRTSLSIAKLTENRVLLLYGDDDNYLIGQLCDITSDTSVSKGSAYKLSSMANSGKVISAVALSKNRVLIIHGDSNNYLYSQLWDIKDSGLIIYTSPHATYKLSSVENSGSTISAVALSEKDIFITHSSGSNYYLYGMVLGYLANIVKTITSSTEKIGGVAITSGQNGEMITTVRPDDVMRIKVNATISTENFGSISWEDIILINRKIADRENNIYSPIKKLMINGENIDFKLGLYPYSDVYKDWGFGFEFSTELYYTANAKTKKYNNGTISKLNNLFAGNLYTGENKTGEHLSATANIEILS